MPNAHQLDTFQQLSPTVNTGALTTPEKSRNTVKLPAPHKIIQIPVAGQPGQYVTGLLPAAPTIKLPPLEDAKPGNKSNGFVKIVSLVAVLLLLIGTAGTLVCAHAFYNDKAKDNESACGNGNA